MSNSDWWNRKLGSTTQPQPQQQPYQQPQQPQQQQYRQPPQQYQQEPPVYEESPSTEKGLIEALNTWGLKGGQAMRQEGHNICPSCGSKNMFGMSNASSVHNINSGAMARAAARCFECGWRQDGTVQGDRSNWM